MDLKTVDAGPPALLALIGRLDIAGVGVVETRFVAATAAQKRPVIVDLSGVTFIGSLGIGMLVGAARALKRYGAELVLLDPDPFVARVLEASNLGEVVPIVHGIEEARRVIAGAGSSPPA